MATREGGEGIPLLLGKLYLDGEEVAGFPPSAQDLEKKMTALGLPFDQNKYGFIYEARPGDNRSHKIDGELRLEPYRKDNLQALAGLCTRHHPYILPADYREEEWRPHEEKRCAFVSDLLQRSDVIGLIAFAGTEEAGFIEGFTLPLAQKLGYPVSGDGSPENSGAVMITCLSVRIEYKGRGAAGRLLEAFETEATRRGNHSVEVLTFPDKLGMGWQPASFYRKRGYETVRQIHGLDLMKKWLN